MNTANSVYLNDRALEGQYVGLSIASVFLCCSVVVTKMLWMIFTESSNIN